MRGHMLRYMLFQFNAYLLRMDTYRNKIPKRVTFISLRNITDAHRFYMKHRMHYSKIDAVENEARNASNIALVNAYNDEYKRKTKNKTVASMRNYRAYAITQTGNSAKIRTWLSMPPEIKNDNAHCMT